MKNFGAAGGKGAGLIITEFMKKPGFGGFVGIGGVDAVDIGPNDELVGVHHVGDDGPGKIGTVATERGDAAIGSCADETGNDWNNAGFKERKKNLPAALFGLFKMRLGVAESVAGQDEIRGSDRHRRYAGFFERSGEEPGAETFAKGGEAIEEFGAGSNGAVSWNFMKKVASQELQLAADAEAFLVAELQIVKHIEVKIQNQLGFVAGMRELAARESASNGKEMVGDALHGGDDHGDIGCLRRGANEACGMEHAVSTEKRTAAKLESDDVPALLAYPAGVMHDFLVSGR